LAASFLFTTSQFGLVNQRRWRSGVAARQRQRRSARLVFIALDESALFAHLHLNGASFAGGIGLFDFAGRLFDQRDLFALSAVRCRDWLADSSAAFACQSSVSASAAADFCDTCRAATARAGCRVDFLSSLGELGDGVYWSYGGSFLSMTVTALTCEPMFAGLHDQGVGFIFRLVR
jgi:hypothetical protein